MQYFAMTRLDTGRKSDKKARMDILSIRQTEELVLHDRWTRKVFSEFFPEPENCQNFLHDEARNEP